MTLLAAQCAFVAEIAADDDVPSSSPGMAIYRNAYRGRLSEALATSFERTKTWVGDEMFELAAAHYILTHPPQSWTLDAFGTDFPEALAELFAEDPEVAELAWLEWHMQQAFAAADRETLTSEVLAAAQPDWESLRLAPAAGLVWREVGHDLSALWHGLSDRSELVATEPAVLLVWRKDLSPHFRLLDPAEFAALESLLTGASFGAAASEVGEADLARFGQWFAQWLSEGLFSAVLH